MADQKIEGISGSLKDGSYSLLSKQENTRLLGLPFAHLTYFYALGEQGITIGTNLERKKMRFADKKEILALKIKSAKSENEKLKYQEKLSRYIVRANDNFEKKKQSKPFVIVSGFNKEKEKEKERAIGEKFDVKVAHATDEKKKNKLLAKKAKKLDKKRRKINQGNQVMRWGEPLSIYDHNYAREAAGDIQDYLFSKGYFQADVKVDTSNYDSLSGSKKVRRKIRNGFSRISGAKLRYIDLTFYVKLNHRYYIDSIQYDIEDDSLRQLISEHLSKAPLQKGYYDQKQLSAERDHIYNLAINNGYYNFSKQFIQFRIDSISLGPDTLLVREVISNPANRDRHKIFRIDSINFIADANIRESKQRTYESYNNITYSLANKKYPKKIIGWRIPLQIRDTYSRDLTFETQRQLSYLDNFKFVNINYDTTGNRLTANIFTSPFDKFQTSSEFGLSSTQGNSAQGNPGPFINVNLKNRNAFNLLEVTSLDFNAKLQDLSPVRENIGSDFSGAYTSRQIGGEFAVTFPLFLFPIGDKYQNAIGKYNPSSRLSVGVTYEDRVGEYERLEYRGALTYRWQVRDRIKYSIVPGQIRWIDSRNSDGFEMFIDSLSDSYSSAFRSAIVNSASFERVQNFGDYNSGNKGSFLSTYIELGGQFNRFLSGSFFGDELEKFSFIKTNVDFRRIERLSRKYNLAYKLQLGYALPFGGNDGLPYDGYFYVGGSNSIRGWRPRRLGPGSFVTYKVDSEGNTTTETDDEQEQPGEILIESSIELRRDLVGFMEGALFVDMGNVWRVKNTTDDPEFDKAVFRHDRFLKQIAIAGGAGIRFDLQFLILRFDLGIKVFDPGKDKGNRFLGRNIFNNFNNNSEINIGIGYPF